MMIGRRIYKLAQDSGERIYNPNQGELFPDEDIFDKVQCNEDGCENYLTSKQIGNSDYYDKYDNPYCSEHVGRHVGQCDNCGKKSPLANLRGGTEQGELFCDDCFDELFVSCPNCTETVDHDDFFPPTGRNQRRSSDPMNEGGCTNCAVKCYDCNKLLEKDGDGVNNVNGYYYCEDCFGEHYSYCDECNEIVRREDSRYVENDGEYCEGCFDDKFYYCYECNEPVERSEAVEYDDENYHPDCAPGGAGKTAEIGVDIDTEAFSGFSYIKKDRLLNPLMKMLPISVKDLKQKNPSLAAGLSDLINFAKGKNLTPELVQEFRASLSSEQFPVEYSTWTSNLQRSVRSKLPQLVLKIIASPEILNKLNKNKVLIDLFNTINNISRDFNHPSSLNQLGWARIEIAQDKEYMLVDEIQMDHMNSAFKMKNRDSRVEKYRIKVRDNNNLTDEQLDGYFPEFLSILKEFPNIASNAVEQFARSNKIKRIFWHTYEGGKKLKGNEPPPSFYTSVPKENLYLPSAERPFGLGGDFFEKEAKKAYLRYKLAQLWTKRFN